jgi:hypothetical protein
MAVVVTVTSANGATRTYAVQDGKSLPAIATAPGDKVQIVDQNSPGVELVMDGDNVTLNWAGGSPAVSFQNLTLYLTQGQTEISVVDQDSNSTTNITSLDELLAGFSTAAGGTATGGGAPGGGFGNDGSIDEQGLEGGAGGPLGLGGGIDPGTPGDIGLGGDAIEPELLAALAANTAPVAVADFAATDEDTPVTVDVLGNDSDPDPGAP